MSLNPQQEACATSFGASMAVMAGAGSGKTYTLRERIANAFDPKVVAGQMEPLASIDEVLAITFTEKAALELKSRVKAVLRERGRVAEAMAVDGAWISTIHGMCSRILRESALTLGLDPAFQVLADDRRAQMLDDATERVLRAGTGHAGDVAALFAEYGRDSLKASVATLVGAAARTPGGLDAIEGPRLDRETAARVAALRRDAAVALSAAEGREVASSEVTLAQLAEHIEDVGPQGRGRVRPQDEEALPWGAGTDLTASQRKDCCCLEVRLAEAARLWEPLLRVTRAVMEEFRQEKLELGVLDNDDLLVEARRALDVPAVRARYQDRFRLVMVDEFQDTDQLQLDIITALAGPGCSRLCVVGDPEQSIYRFRGADLSVCARHLAGVARTGRTYISLADNYRSHEDVLDFVDEVFSPAEGEGQGYYQRLRHARDEDQVPAARRFREGEGPRVEVVDAEWTHGHGAWGREFWAAHVARRFRALHDASGRPYGQMVVLLGKMTHADAYARALDDEGIPCAVTGGSVLSGEADAQLVVALARTLANPRDDEAAYQLLASDVFGLTDADLLALCEAAGLPGRSRSRVGAALECLLGRAPVGDGEGEALPQELAEGRVGHAVDTLARAERRLASQGLSRVMEGVLADSGWLGRMQQLPSAGGGEDGREVSVTGQARAANALKVVRMARDLEEEGTRGPRAVSKALAVRLASAKEAPGVLSAKGSDFVRIMTIHASKGLQFPVVAVAELDGAAPPAGGRVRAYLVDGHGRATLDLEESVARANRRMQGCAAREKARRSLATLPSCPEGGVADADAATLSRLVAEAEAAGDLAARAAALAALDERLDDEELERRLYVAFTRAEEALVVCMGGEASAKAIDGRLKELSDDEVPGVGETLRLATTTSKKVPAEEKAAAKARRDELRLHVSVPQAAELTGVPARIRAHGGRLVARGCSYLVASAAEVARWAQDGTLPPAWQGQGGGAVWVDFDEGDASEETPEAPAVGVPTTPAPDGPGRLRFAPLAPWGLTSASTLEGPHGGPTDGEDGLPVPAPVSFDGGLDEATGAEPAPSLPSGASATERGSAFHLLAEVAARRWRPGGELAMPADRLRPTARLFGLTAAQEARLAAEMRTWLASPVASAVAARAHLEPEAPFFVSLPVAPGPGAHPMVPPALQGYIDLLAYDGRGAGHALVVDYKTGRFLDTDAARREAYAVQAKTYAYALLRQGFSEVTLHFVFVDQPDAEGRPAVCTFPGPGEAPYDADALGSELAGLLAHKG